MLGLVLRIRNYAVMAWGVLAMAWDGIIHRHQEPK